MADKYKEIIKSCATTMECEYTKMRLSAAEILYKSKNMEQLFAELTPFRNKTVADCVNIIYYYYIDTPPNFAALINATIIMLKKIDNKIAPMLIERFQYILFELTSSKTVVIDLNNISNIHLNYINLTKFIKLDCADNIKNIMIFFSKYLLPLNDYLMSINKGYVCQDICGFIDLFIFLIHYSPSCVVDDSIKDIHRGDIEYYIEILLDEIEKVNTKIISPFPIPFPEFEMITLYITLLVKMRMVLPYLKDIAAGQMHMLIKFMETLQFDNIYFVSSVLIIMLNIFKILTSKYINKNNFVMQTGLSWTEWSIGL